MKLISKCILYLLCMAILVAISCKRSIDNKQKHDLRNPPANPNEIQNWLNELSEEEYELLLQYQEQESRIRNQRINEIRLEEREYHKKLNYLVGVIINRFRDVDQIKIYYHSRPEHDVPELIADGRDMPLTMLTGSDVSAFIKSFTPTQTVEEIYSTGHGVGCNCIANSFHGWRFDFYSKGALIANGVTADCSKIYLYSNVLHHEINIGDLSRSSNAISLLLGSLFKSFYESLLNSRNIRTDDKKFKWY